MATAMSLGVSCPEQLGRQGSLILYFGVTMLKLRNTKKRIAQETKYDDGFSIAIISLTASMRQRLIRTSCMYSLMDQSRMSRITIRLKTKSLWWRRALGPWRENVCQALGHDLEATANKDDGENSAAWVSVYSHKRQGVNYETELRNRHVTFLLIRNHPHGCSL